MARTRKTKTTKKTTRKRSVRKVAADVVGGAVATKKVVDGGGFKRKVWLGFSVLLLGLVVFQFKGVFVAAVVNGQPVSRLELVRNLERQQGKQALEALITEKLIYQKAGEAGVEVNQEEIDAEVARFEEEFSAQGQTLDQLLELQGVKMSEFVEQVKLQKLVEKLAAGEVEVSDEQVQEYIENNQETLGDDVSGEELRERVAEQLRQQEVSTAIQSWLTGIRGDAKVDYWAEL